jgi:predicted RNA binding protein YcfA (HicA-like mRNA interferase family)
MPKLPRVSGKDLVEGLTKLGFEVARQKGSHVALKRVDRAAWFPFIARYERERCTES